MQRGHEVWLQTAERWREDVECEHMRFAPAPEYSVFPTRERPLQPYAAAVKAAQDTRPLVGEIRPDAVVADILTVHAGLAAELERRPWMTLIPHLLPEHSPGLPPYSTGARLPRTRAGAALWRLFDPLLERGVQRGREQLNGARERVGLPAVTHLHGGISRMLALVATFPQLEYPRPRWPAHASVTGPLLWQPPGPAIEPPAGEGPLVLVAPSTSQDPEQRMLRAALEGLAEEPVRVLAATNGRAPAVPLEVPPNARLVDWLSYADAMPRCEAVVCHAGHGTLARALASGVPVLACPIAGDMAENAVRVAWAGAGLSLPGSLIGPRAIRLAVRRLLADPGYRRRAGELGQWAACNDGGVRAAAALEARITAGT